MSLMKWSDRYSVRVAEIDRQHKKLIEMLNVLQDSMKTGKGHEVMEKTLSDLERYAAEHFRTEEKYMFKYDYPAYKEHKNKHDQFISKVKDFERKYQARQVTLTVEVLSFLSDWLFKHILKEDKEYSQFFNDHGLT